MRVAYNLVRDAEHVLTCSDAQNVQWWKGVFAVMNIGGEWKKQRKKSSEFFELKWTFSGSLGQRNW